MDLRLICFCIVLATFVHDRVSGTDPIDIVLLLDSSDQFRSDSFDSEIRFALNFVKKAFTNDNRIGLYTYGSQTHMQFSLNMYHTLQDINQAIKYMWYSTGNGDLNSAINYTVSNAFKKSSGNRDCIRNALIILTHSSVSDAESASAFSDILSEAAIRTFVLRMSNNTNGEDTLITLTNATSRLMKLPDFQALETSTDVLMQNILSDLPRTGCGILTPWETWTKCSTSCGSGLHLRMRRCERIYDSDKECNGDLSEDRPCAQDRCHDPLDGGWSNWGNWGPCSKTCKNGTQTRSRECNEPMSYNGGKPCPGSRSQDRKCAQWKCPDCNKTCPAGGHLSLDCEICECSSVILFGRVMDNLKEPVKEASVFLESRKYTPIAKTDNWGYFNATGVCIMNEIIHIDGGGYSPVDVIPTEVNTTHWSLTTTVSKYIPPIFKTQPHSKIRMEGQSISLCCEAIGTPSPSTYRWFKDGIELESIGTNGILTFSSISKSDAATYMCSAETEAGVSQSEKAIVTVADKGTDTCSNPTAKLQSLSDGCFVADDATKNSTIDIGTCGKSACMKSSLQDNGTCSDWWGHHCCDVDNIEVLNIMCDGYSYKTTRVKSCKCNLCVFKTIISGKAYGINNGKNIPFSLGEISSNGRPKGRTNMAGYFRFEIPKGIKRVIVTFHDSIFKKFIDSTKIIQVTEGLETPVTIVLPLKPTPIPFTPSVGTDIQIGGDSNELPAAGSISIAEDSLMTLDGHPHKGPAKASVHFMDPRKREDIEAANGDFVYESPGGDQLPLQTFGMFQVGVEDHAGNELRINKPITFSLDASLFNIPLDKDGNPDLALWYYDSNKGIWVEQSKMQFSAPAGGRRRLLSGSLTGTVPPISIPKMDPYNYHNISVPSGRYTNCDQSVPIYENKVIREPNPKAGVCYVSVSVYEDFTLNTPLKDGILVTAFSQQLDGSSYLASESRPINEHGHVCMTVFCDKLVYIKVVAKGQSNLLPANHFLPYGYDSQIKSLNTDHEVKFTSRYFGSAYDCSMDGRTNTCNGPMYQFTEYNKCKDSHSDKSFRFNFAPFTKAPVLNLVGGSINVYYKKLSWYPVSPDKNTFKSCFIKVGIKVEKNFDIRVIGTSYLDKVGGDQFGTHDVGPEPDPTSTDFSTRAACIEFRCPGFIKDGAISYYKNNTVVEAKIVTKNKLTCNMSSSAIGLKISGSTNGFQFVAESGNNYGMKFGVYIHDDDSSKVRDFCYSGFDTGPQVDGIMKPTTNAAVQFACS